jgi:lambda family phage portal protein
MTRKSLKAEPRIRIEKKTMADGTKKVAMFERTGPTQVGFGGQLPYRAASIYGRGEDYALGNPGPNASLLGAGEMLRARGRDLYRQNGQAAGGVDSIITELIGPGFSMIPATGDKVFDAEMLEILADWEEQADFYGLKNWDGVLTAAERGAFVAGDHFLQLVYGRYRNDGVVPLQIKGLESEFCPLSETQQYVNGDRAMMGILLGRDGRRKGFRMYREHPEDWAGLAIEKSQEIITIPKDIMLQRIWNARDGQLRGESGLARAIIALYGKDFYIDNELVRKQAVSQISMVISRAANEGGTFADGWADAAGDEGVEAEYHEEGPVGELRFQPGDVISLQPGETATTMQAADVGGSFEPFVKYIDRQIATSLGALYEHVSNDWSSGNDRMHKSARNHFERHMGEIQYQQIVPQTVRPIYRAVLNSAVLSGIIKPPRGMSDRQLRQAMFVPTEWSYVHPVQEETARQKRLEMGISSREREAAGMGERIEDIDAERAADEDARRQDETQRDGNAAQGARSRRAVYDNGEKVYQPQAAAKSGFLKKLFGWRR